MKSNALQGMKNAMMMQLPSSAPGPEIWVRASVRYPTPSAKKISPQHVHRTARLPINSVDQARLGA